MIQCRLAINDDGWGTGATLTCRDVLGAPVVEITGRGVALSPEGEVRAALRKVVEQLHAKRPRFEALQVVDILSRLPIVETHALTEGELEQMAAEGKLSEPIEGLWSSGGDSDFRLGIVSAGRDFAAIILGAPSSYLWQPGMVRARFTATADDHTYTAKWRMEDRTEVNGIARVNGGTLTIVMRRAGKEETSTFLKLRSGSKRSTVSVSSSSGTGFFCAPGIVATNAHVVDGARSLQMYLPVQKKTLNLEVQVVDAGNDLALLRVVGEEIGNLPSPLPLADGADVKLGAEALVVGFPLGDVLGVDHKVTSGLVSALDGLNGDPRKLQLTAPIQPGSSGSPVFERSGRVIGIVTSTLDAMSSIRASGSLPQNVNFAVKSDYLGLLLRRIPLGGRKDGLVGANAASLPELIERVRQSVGQIRASR